LYEGDPLSIGIISPFLKSKSIIAFFIQYDICSGYQKCQLFDVIVSSYVYLGSYILISLQIFPIEFLTNLYLQFFTFHQWSQMGPFAPFCETMAIMLKATQGQSVFWACTQEVEIEFIA
jgi:hypothetical protein